MAMSCGAPSRITRTRGALSTASRSSVRLARSSCAMPISALVTSTMPNRASCGWPTTRITASKTPRMKLKRVKMFARRISATERLVRSPPTFVSPRARCSATWALVRPAAGVSAAGAVGAGGGAAAGSAMPGHRAAGKGQRKARPGRGAGTGDIDSGVPAHLTLPGGGLRTRWCRHGPAPGQMTMVTTRRPRPGCLARGRLRQPAPGRGHHPRPAASQPERDLPRGGVMGGHPGGPGQAAAVRRATLPVWRRGVLTGAALRAAGPAHCRPRGRRFRGGGGGSRQPGPRARRRRRWPR